MESALMPVAFGISIAIFVLGALTPKEAPKKQEKKTEPE